MYAYIDSEMRKIKSNLLKNQFLSNIAHNQLCICNMFKEVK